ncbi:hypothetical protein Ae168Ps1_6160 [Pseudonocardia sp. Ae168_Ps1]|nr:hypothetical protein Ae150APs1_6093 [Pseudonocardia sp. Ae150A_Ps1]OLL70695.1 hypothetical protein Ae168Ps1_6160 [Pseudonocardia sp. Ae168_Ps1]
MIRAANASPGGLPATDAVIMKRTVFAGPGTYR